MTPVDTSLRPFQPGSTGWSAADLDDPQIERLWFQGRYEIVDGVLTNMAPAYYAGGKSWFKLARMCQEHADQHGPPGWFAAEVEIVLDETRVLRADAAFLTREDEKRQKGAAQLAGRSDPARTRILIPPTLIIESVSPGHEQHDRRTKFRWYAEFGVANYWILDAFQKSLDCWVLDGASYRPDASGKASAEIRPALFQGLAIPLGQLWDE